MKLSSALVNNPHFKHSVLGFKFRNEELTREDIEVSINAYQRYPTNIEEAQFLRLLEAELEKQPDHVIKNARFYLGNDEWSIQGEVVACDRFPKGGRIRTSPIRRVVTENGTVYEIESWA